VQRNRQQQLATMEVLFLGRERDPGSAPFGWGGPPPPLGAVHTFEPRPAGGGERRGASRRASLAAYTLANDAGAPAAGPSGAAAGGAATAAAAAAPTPRRARPGTAPAAGRPGTAQVGSRPATAATSAAAGAGAGAGGAGGEGPVYRPPKPFMRNRADRGRWRQAEHDNKVRSRGGQSCSASLLMLARASNRGHCTAAHPPPSAVPPRTTLLLPGRSCWRPS